MDFQTFRLCVRCVIFKNVLNVHPSAKMAFKLLRVLVAVSLFLSALTMTTLPHVWLSACNEDVNYLNSNSPVSIGSGTANKNIFNIALSLQQYRFLDAVLDSMTGRSWCLAETLLRLCETTDGMFALYRVDTNEAVCVTRHQYQFIAYLKIPIVRIVERQRFSFDERNHDYVADYWATETKIISAIYSGIWRPRDMDTLPPREPAAVPKPIVSEQSPSTTVVSSTTDISAISTTTNVLPTTAFEPSNAVKVSNDVDVALKAVMEKLALTDPPLASGATFLERVLAAFPSKEQTAAELASHVNLQAFQLAQALVLVQNAVKAGKSRTASLPATLVRTLVPTVTQMLLERGWHVDLAADFPSSVDVFLVFRNKTIPVTPQHAE